MTESNAQQILPRIVPCGNIVLVLRQEEAFRVHKSILGQTLKVFRDLFDVPHPEDEQEVEGCPVIHLSEDPEEFGAFLSLIYHAWKCAKLLSFISQN